MLKRRHSRSHDHKACNPRPITKQLMECRTTLNRCRSGTNRWWPLLAELWYATPQTWPKPFSTVVSCTTACARWVPEPGARQGTIGSYFGSIPLTVTVPKHGHSRALLHLQQSFMIALTVGGADPTAALNSWPSAVHWHVAIRAAAHMVLPTISWDGGQEPRLQEILQTQTPNSSQFAAAGPLAARNPQ